MIIGRRQSPPFKAVLNRNATGPISIRGELSSVRTINRLMSNRGAAGNGMVSPVIHRASSDARKDTRRAISSGFPARPSGVAATALFFEIAIDYSCPLCVLGNNETGIDSIDANPAGAQVPS